ncbi:unnamed protein product, partial [Ectocarpus sp. 12 AP-2014]
MRSSRYTFVPFCRPWGTPVKSTTSSSVVLWRKLALSLGPRLCSTIDRQGRDFVTCVTLH